METSCNLICSVKEFSLLLKHIHFPLKKMVPKNSSLVLKPSHIMDDQCCKPRRKFLT